MTKAGFVLFRLGGQAFVTGLDAVREIVRLDQVTPLPGARPPLVGVATLRGLPLPVLDTRPVDDERPARGDVLVANLAGGVVGVAVDQVLAVLAPEDLTDAGAPPQVLPAYVVGVLTYEDAPVFLVDLPALLHGTGDGWEEALGEVATA